MPTRNPAANLPLRLNPEGLKPDERVRSRHHWYQIIHTHPTTKVKGNIPCTYNVIGIKRFDVRRCNRLYEMVPLPQGTDMWFAPLIPSVHEIRY